MSPPPAAPPSPAARAMGLARRWRDTAIDLVFPPACLACQAATSTPATLCATCWGATRFIERPYCERLGTPFAQDLGPGTISPECYADPPAYGRARAVARFEDGPARMLVHRLKYSDRGDLARPMGRWMARAGADLLGEADLVVPVPLHRWRLWSRRFNQAMALAKAIGDAARLPVDPLVLERVKPTSSQVGRSRAQRAANLQGAFRVPEERRPGLSGLRVVLVDDVLTSGATCNAAARALLRAGAADVDVLVFARVVAGA